MARLLLCGSILCGSLLGIGTIASALPTSPSEPQVIRAPVPRTAPETRPDTDAFRIVAFGSSSTEGVGASKPALAYPAQVERMLNDPSRRGPVVSVVNRGIGGEDIDDMLGRLEADILARKPDLVVWQVGSNDPLRGVPPARFEQELREGIAAMRRAGVEVFLLGPQWCPALDATGTAAEIRSIIRRVGEDEKVDVLRRYDLMQGWIRGGLVTKASLIGADGLHMTDRGYTLLAQAVSDEIAAMSSAYRRRKSFASASADRHPTSPSP